MVMALQGNGGADFGGIYGEVNWVFVVVVVVDAVADVGGNWDLTFLDWELNMNKAGRYPFRRS